MCAKRSAAEDNADHGGHYGINCMGLPLPATTSWTNRASYSVSAYVPASNCLGFQERWAACQAASSAYCVHRIAR